MTSLPGRCVGRCRARLTNGTSATAGVARSREGPLSDGRWRARLLLVRGCFHDMHAASMRAPTADTDWRTRICAPSVSSGVPHTRRPARSTGSARELGRGPAARHSTLGSQDMYALHGHARTRHTPPSTGRPAAGTGSPDTPPSGTARPAPDTPPSTQRQQAHTRHTFTQRRQARTRHGISDAPPSGTARPAPDTGSGTHLRAHRRARNGWRTPETPPPLRAGWHPTSSPGEASTLHRKADTGFARCLQRHRQSGARDWFCGTHAPCTGRPLRDTWAPARLMHPNRHSTPHRSALTRLGRGAAAPTPQHTSAPHGAPRRTPRDARTPSHARIGPTPDIKWTPGTGFVHPQPRPASRVCATLRQRPLVCGRRGQPEGMSNGHDGRITRVPLT
ncbi:MAG: hypothetical protein K0R81_398 [Microbacterium sp.]|nr:hypothetical protein [Microbacterium sp.]